MLQSFRDGLKVDGEDEWEVKRIMGMGSIVRRLIILLRFCRDSYRLSEDWLRQVVDAMVVDDVGVDEWW
jgi:hypothetical protein